MNLQRSNRLLQQTPSETVQQELASLEMIKNLRKYWNNDFQDTRYETSNNSGH